MVAQVLVRNIDDHAVDALRVRAKNHGQSLEAELRDVLRSVAAAPRRERASEAAAIRALTPPGAHRLAEDLVREGRDER